MSHSRHKNADEGSTRISKLQWYALTNDSHEGTGLNLTTARINFTHHALQHVLQADTHALGKKCPTLNRENKISLYIQTLKSIQAHGTPIANDTWYDSGTSAKTTSRVVANVKSSNILILGKALCELERFYSFSNVRSVCTHMAENRGLTS